ncbi:MAG: hypothetical protein LBR30_07605 [Clostridioides sp.]|nr:hypothetical protein [Clostridioides sp.]
MLKIGEKVIYETYSDKFDLKGIGRYSRENKILFITNLGNIYIGSGDEIDDLENERYVYNFSDKNIQLEVSISNNDVYIEGMHIPFEVILGDYETREYANLRLKITIFDFEKIILNQKQFIFKIKEKKAILNLDRKENFLVDLNIDNEKMTFSTSKDIFEIYYKDIEKFILKQNYLSCKGYFHLEKKEIVVKSMLLFSNDIVRKISVNLREVVENNKKIGSLPSDAVVCYASFSGNIANINYENLNVFLIKCLDKFIIVNKKTKKQIINIDIKHLKKLDLGETTVFCNNDNVFSVNLKEKDKEMLQISKLKEITDSNIGFSLNGVPFFFKHSEDYFKIYKSLEDDLINIENTSIRDIIIGEESENIQRDYVLAKIIFDNNQVELYMKKSVAENLIENVYTCVVQKISANMSIKEVYDNYAKANNDIVLYNFFGGIFNLREEIKNIAKNKMSDEKKVDIINLIYNRTFEVKRDLDVLSEYYLRELKSLVKYSAVLSNENIFVELNRKFSTYIAMIENCLNRVSFVISGESKVKFNYKQLSEANSYRLDGTVREIISILNHLVRTLYPSYIEEVSRFVKDFFEESYNIAIKNKSGFVKEDNEFYSKLSIVKEDDKIDNKLSITKEDNKVDNNSSFVKDNNESATDSEILEIDDENEKQLVIDEIRRIYLFKQSRVKSDILIRKKDIISKLYKLSDNIEDIFANGKYLMRRNLSNLTKTVWKENYRLVDFDVNSNTNANDYKDSLSYEKENRTYDLQKFENHDKLILSETNSYLDESLNVISIDEELKKDKFSDEEIFGKTSLNSNLKNDIFEEVFSESYSNTEQSSNIKENIFLDESEVDDEIKKLLEF